MHNKTVVITGASAGVGRAAARAFGRRGWRVGLLARGIEGLEAARAEVEAAGGEALVLPADVSDAGQVEAAAARMEATFGSIDVWVNNAMVTVFAPFQQITAEEFRRATEVTYLGVVHGTRAALKRMVPRDHGTIVQVGSALAYRSIPLQSAYCGAKAAIRGFTDSIRSELIHDGSRVRLTMVQLPAINTPQFQWSVARLPNAPQPLPPIYQPEVAADAIWHAARGQHRELWVGGPVYQAILGHKVMPAALDRYLATAAWDGQQIEAQPLPPGRPNNLWAPVPGDHGAHGPFDDRAVASSPQLWLMMNRDRLFGLLLTGLAGLFALLLQPAPSRPERRPRPPPEGERPAPSLPGGP